MQRLLGYLAASVHSRLNRLQNHSTYFSQCRTTAKHIALICRRKKNPSNLPQLLRLFDLPSSTKKTGCLCSLNYWNRLIYFPIWFSKRFWLTWHRTSCHTWHHVSHKGNKLNYHNSSGWHHVRHKGNKLNFHNSSGRSLLYKKLLLRKI